MQVVRAEIVFVCFDGRNVAHVPRVVAARDGIDAVLVLHIGHPIQNVALVHDGRFARSHKPACNPRVVRHAVAPAAPPLALGLFQGAKRYPRHVKRVDVRVVRPLHEKARGGKVGCVRRVNAKNGIGERAVAGVEGRFVMDFSPREPSLRLVLYQVEIFN